MIGTNSAHFGRGETGYNGVVPNANALLFEEILGTIKNFPDRNPITNADLTGLQVTCILLRNTTGAALLPKDVIKLDGTRPTKDASAKSTAANQLFAVVDEYLPAGGVADDDVFWAVIKGPTTAKAVTVSGAQAAGQLAVGTSGTAGKVDFTPTSAASAIIAQNQAAYGHRAFTEGAIANNATEYRIYINNNFFGQ